MNILFINGSPNSNGNTAALAKELLQGKEYETLNLTDFRIGSYGQNFEDDELDQVIAKMKQAEVIVIGSPLYWHNICGSVRNILDRFYGLVENGSLSGRTLYFLFQGAAPEKWMLEAGEYTMKRFAGLYGMKYAGFPKWEIFSPCTHTILSDTFCARSISCKDMITVIFFSLAIFSRIARSSSLCFTSKKEVGSSRIRISGS